jgi:hypothetical protein
MSRSHAVLALAALLAILALLSLLSPIARADRSKPRPGKPAAAAPSAPSVTDGRVHDFPRSAAVRASAPGMNSALDPDAPPHPLAPYIDVLAETRRRLCESVISISFNDASLAEVLADVERKCGVPLRHDLPPDTPSTISFVVRELSADQVLSLLSRMSGLVCVVDDVGTMWIVAEGEETGHLPPESHEIARLEFARHSLHEDTKQASRDADDRTALAAFADTRRMFGVNGLPFLDAVDSFKEAFGWNVVVVASARESADPAPIEIRDRTRSAVEALEEILAKGPNGWYMQNRVVIIGDRENAEGVAQHRRETAEALNARREELRRLLARTVSIEGTNLAVRDVADLLSHELGIPVALDALTWRRLARFDIEEGDRPAADIVAALTATVPLVVTLHDGTLWFLAPGDAQ